MSVEPQFISVIRNTLTKSEAPRNNSLLAEWFAARIPQFA
jgi:hypothetical protein